MSANWCTPFTDKLDMAPFGELQQRFDLTALSAWPQAAGLNQLADDRDIQVPVFKCQSQVNFEEGYYEQIIFEQGVVPTRPDNWHDLFNALIWMQFPHTKRLLNRLHIEDINQHGLSPRSAQRNRITHFDECGIVLVSRSSDIPAMLAEHQWHRAFVEHRDAWGRDIQVFVFGHANLEMLLNPFIGLTGKWLHVSAVEGYFDWSGNQQLAWLDKQLSKEIKDGDVFNQPGCLKPIPLLGIPGWWDANRDPTFYDNTDYFRPKRQKTSPRPPR